MEQRVLALNHTQAVPSVSGRQGEPGCISLGHWSRTQLALLLTMPLSCLILFSDAHCSGFVLNHSKFKIYFCPWDPRSDLMTRVHLCSVHLGYTLTWLYLLSYQLHLTTLAILNPPDNPQNLHHTTFIATFHGRALISSWSIFLSVLSASFFSFIITVYHSMSG